MMNNQASISTVLSSEESRAAVQQLSSLRTHRRLQQGSLPLKKRRFRDLSGFHEDVLLPRPQGRLHHAGRDDSLLRPPLALSLLGNESSASPTESNPLLALVAAAANASSFSWEPLHTPSPPEYATTPSTTPPPPTIVSHFVHSNSIIPPTPSKHDMIHKEQPSPQEQHTPQEGDGTCHLVTPVPHKPTAQGSSDKISPRQRVHHPPLLTPLPNGCHGRTSRNNSYCRRQPCYNGSKYCKLHYQQYIVTGTRPPTASTGGSAIVEGGDSSNSSGSVTPPQIVPAALVQQHQDKRFSGLEGEARCRATTTRGRECAYVAVNGTRYCHLHSDYDTNPPPRRGGIVKGKAPPQLNLSRPLGTPKGLAPSPRTPKLFKKLLSSAKPAATPEKSVPALSSSSGKNGTAQNETTALIASTMTTSQPLLSSMSSDQWFNRRVLISTGPLMNHTGRVVRWGNGWVTVKTPAESDGEPGLLHNRRSIELFLLPEEEEKPNKGEQEETEATLPTTKEETEAESGQVEVVATATDVPRQETSEATAVRHPEADKNAVEENGFSLSEEEEDRATLPMKTSVTEISVAEENDDLPSAGSQLSTEEESKSPTHGPRTNQEESQVTEPENRKEEWTAEEDTKAPAPAEQVDAEEHPITVKVESDVPHQITPSYPRTISDVASSVADCGVLDENKEGGSLADCLVAAEEGRRHDYKSLALLFGTAALERSRRTVQKPTRYEDTAMLERKRSRSMFSGQDEGSPRSPKQTRMEIGGGLISGV